MTTSPFNAAFDAEQAALNARFCSSARNAQKPIKNAEEAARAARQCAEDQGGRRSDSRTFTPAVRRLLRAAQDAEAAATYLRAHP